MYEPGSEAVQWWTKAKDTVRDREAAGLLDRCTATKSCPKIMETLGSAELYGRVNSIEFHGTSHDRDIPQRKDVRIYYFPGTSHGGGSGGFTHAAATSSSYVLGINPNPETQTWRALQRAMVRWVVKGEAMPKSNYPTIKNGDFVENTAEAMGWPNIPDVPSPTDKAIGLLDYDYGTLFDYNNLSGYHHDSTPYS